MAGFLTAYIEYMSDLGIGAAVIQKHNINCKELSSLFWLSVTVGFILALLAIGLAYPTALLFHDNRIIPVTSLISINFLIGSLSSLPNGVLRRDFKFKYIGIANMVAAIISCLCQIFFATLGWGVYTLVYGVIIFRSTRTILTFLFSKWFPYFHFSFLEVKPYLKFGLGLAGGAAIHRLNESLDKLIVGKKFDATSLGNYGFSMSLSNLPLDKILPIFQQVTFPLLSRILDNTEDRNKTFLNNLKFCLYLSAPLLIGGAFQSHDIIMGFLGEKWMPIVTMFRVFCVVKLIELIRSFVGILFTSSGDSKNPFIFTLVLLFIMPSSIFFSSFFGLKYIIIPWVTLYPFVSIIWIIYTLNKFSINILIFLKELSKPILFSFLFTSFCVIIKTSFGFLTNFINEPRVFIIGYLFLGFTISFLFFPIFEKATFISLLKMFHDKNTSNKIKASNNEKNTKHSTWAMLQNRESQN